jgi:hypothetical protein
LKAVVGVHVFSLVLAFANASYDRFSGIFAARDRPSTTEYGGFVALLGRLTETIGEIALPSWGLSSPKTLHWPSFGVVDATAAATAR